MKRPSKQQLKWLAGRIMLAGAGVILAIALIEISARWGGIFPEPQPAWFRVLNTLVGNLIDPYEVYKLDGEDEFDVLVGRNSRGLRDIEHLPAKPPQTFRILILGDSFMEAGQVPLEDSFAWLLQAKLNEIVYQKYASTTGVKPRVEIINAGISAYGTDQELLYYQYEGFRYQADLVLLAFYIGNDVQNNYYKFEMASTNRPFMGRPFFTLEDDKLKLACGKSQLEATLAQNFFILNRLAALLDPHFQRFPCYQPPVIEANCCDNAELASPRLIELEAYRTPPPAEAAVDWSQAWQLSQKLVGELRRQVEADGARFAMFIIPSRRQVHAEDWAETLVKYPQYAQDKFDLAQPNRTFTALLSAEKVVHLDLLADFRAYAAATRERLYLLKDGHFNQTGHQVAAGLVADWLVKRNLLPGFSTKEADLIRAAAHPGGPGLNLALPLAAIGGMAGVFIISHRLPRVGPRPRSCLLTIGVLCGLLGLCGGVELYFRNFFARSDRGTVSLAARNWFTRYWVPLNSLGYRDEEWRPEEVAAKTRVVVAGDSLVAGYGIKRAEDRFANVLGHLLGPDYVVMNVAAGDWNTSEQFEALLRYPYQPDILILAYPLNDIEATALSTGRPRPITLPQPSPWLQPLVENSYALNFAYWSTVQAAISQQEQLYWQRLAGLYHDPDLWWLHEQKLRFIQERSVAAHIPLLVVVFPSLQAVEITGPLANQVTTFFRDQGVPTLNVAEMIQGQASEDLVVSRLDAHPNETMQRRVAEGLYELMQRELPIAINN